ncbi:MAG TPA: VCBS repeat-containing protein [Bryobacteraceae bacterium]|nr:VCBS repeat-containing protein [Bryobacteraceae bacterium]
MKKALSASILIGFAVVAAIALRAQLNRERGNGPHDSPESTYFVHRLGTDHAEGITMLDMNGDGRPDLLSGAYWYENPGPQGGEWKRHQYRTVDITGEFVSDCGEWAVDVNHDGAPDVVTVGWMTDGLWWYENPKKQGVLWPRHLIAHTVETEGGWLADINGDGKPDLALAHYGRSGVIWVDFAGPQPKVHHLGGHDEDGHGIGMADIDGDGKTDVMTPNGWFQNIDADHDKWQWHPDWKLNETGFPIIGYDVNNDGKMDLIFGRGHSYGLYWLEQQGEAANRHWVQHTIDESFSQVHALKLVDLDGDGQPELLAGKRYRGHNGNDPGSYDPLVVYYYKIDRKTGSFTRYPVSVNGTGAAGTQFVTADLDGDGDMDIATAGKTGVHFFENLQINKVPRAVREQELLLDKNWPFPGEGQNAVWLHGKK